VNKYWQNLDFELIVLIFGIEAALSLMKLIEK
jgi:hypothetical protein